ncbi:MAG: type 4a pilus biogenesis protein PilO [Oligoflexia bacterium]|nr:type 4a pilus biogenesis protein PilO [Oligoflexia bacterium]
MSTELLKTLTAKRESIMIFLVIVVIFIFFTKLWYFKQESTIQSIKDEISELTNQTTNYKENLNGLTGINQVVNEQLNIVNTLNVETIKIENNVPSLIKKITELSDLSKIQLKKIKLIENKNKIFFNEYSISVEVESSFLILGHFLESMEKIPMPINVKSIEISRLDQDLKNCFARIIILGNFEREDANK